MEKHYLTFYLPYDALPLAIEKHLGLRGTDQEHGVLAIFETLVTGRSRVTAKAFNGGNGKMSIHMEGPDLAEVFEVTKRFEEMLGV